MSTRLQCRKRPIQCESPLDIGLVWRGRIPAQEIATLAHCVLYFYCRKGWGIGPLLAFLFWLRRLPQPSGGDALLRE